MASVSLSMAAWVYQDMFKTRDLIQFQDISVSVFWIYFNWHKIAQYMHSFCCSESILPYQTHTGCAKILVAAQPGQQTGNQCCLQTIGQSPEVTLSLY